MAPSPASRGSNRRTTARVCAARSHAGGTAKPAPSAARRGRHQSPCAGITHHPPAKDRGGEDGPWGPRGRRGGTADAVVPDGGATKVWSGARHKTFPPAHRPARRSKGAGPRKTAGASTGRSGHRSGECASSPAGFFPCCLSLPFPPGPAHTSPHRGVKPVHARPPRRPWRVWTETGRKRAARRAPGVTRSANTPLPSSSVQRPQPRPMPKPVGELRRPARETSHGTLRLPPVPPSGPGRRGLRPATVGPLPSLPRHTLSYPARSVHRSRETGAEPIRRFCIPPGGGFPGRVGRRSNSG
jgi:hypothetical protein